VSIEILNTRLLPVAREATFRAFAKAEVLARWWAPAGQVCHVQELEARPGGGWRLSVGSPQGEELHAGVFLQAEEPARLVLRQEAPQSLDLAIDMVPHEGGTMLTCRVLFRSVEDFEAARGFHLQPSEQRLDRLEAMLVPTPRRGTDPATRLRIRA
jgi:uncharacterized protein YndB with AHSA1/START domain